MAKSSRFQHSYRSGASKLHKAVGDALRSGPFKHMKIFQEYPLVKINPNGNSKYHVDWVILDLKVAIECHGEQHYKPVNFGGISDEESVDNFADTRFRDAQKEQAVISAGWTYLIIPYQDLKQIDSSYLTHKLDSHWSWEPSVCLDSPEVLDHKEKQRQYRKQQYKQAKEWRRRNEGDSRYSEDNSKTSKEEI